MDGIGRVTSAELPFVIKGQTYLLKKIGFRDLGLIEKALLSEEAERELASVESMKVALSPEEYAEVRQKKIDQLASRVGISEERVFRAISTARGMSWALWACLEDRYPGEFTPVSLLEMIQGGDITPDQIESLWVAIGRSMGFDPQGEVSGPPQKKKVSRNRSRSKKQKR